MIKTKKTTSQYLFLLVILFVSFFLRFYRLKHNVPSLYSDELGHLQLLNILQQPLNLSHLLNKIIYFPFTFTWLFGLTVFGIRFGTAFFGSLIPIFVFFFVRALDRKNIQVALISSALTAVLPWSFMISKGAYTHIPLITIFTLIHLTLFIKAKRPIQYLVSFVPLFFATIYYPSMIVISALAIPFYVYYIYNQARTKKQRQVILTISFVFFLAIIGILFTKYGGLTNKSRGVSLVITNDINVTSETNLYRGYSQKTSPSIFSFGLPTEKIANRVLYNFPSAVVRQFTETYLSFFSPEFLFLTGDHVLRHSTNQFGAFLPVLLPFMIYGTFVFFGKAKKKNRWLLLLWMIISPVPAAITNDGARYLLRAITLMPILTYLSAVGIVSFISLFRARIKIIVSVITFSLVLFSAYSFFFGYFHVYPTLSAQSYEYGFKELSDFQTKNGNQPLLVLWEDSYPNSYFRYYQKTDLKKNIEYQKKEIVIGDSVFIQTFDNLYFSWPKSKKDLDLFLQKYQVTQVAFPKTYLLNNPQYKLLNTQSIEHILFPDQSTAFTIFY